MFTGIIEGTGLIENVLPNGSNLTFTIASALSDSLKPDQSLSHDGVCLTVESVTAFAYTVTAIAETLQKTTVGKWEAGKLVNLERCLRFDGRLDGHIVQGHVDTVAECIARSEKSGSWEYRFSFDKRFAALIVEKGSISLNGISLTIFDISEKEFSVAIIPYTFTHTNMGRLLPGEKVNIEFDMIAKYVNRLRQTAIRGEGDL